MPALSPSALINAILNAIQQSGGSGAYTSQYEVMHPRIFVVERGDDAFSIWIYIWTLTPGGRTTLPNEYRIQMTSVGSPLPLNAEGYTVLMGYHPDLNIFAGFDLARHRQFTEGSPSVQISIEVIHQALQNGLAFGVKTNDEIAVGVRPDQFLHYVMNAEAFHTSGADAQTRDLLVRASQMDVIPAQDIESLTAERQVVVTNVARYSRSGNFRQQVLSAYENRCAVTRGQLRLVDAAHILPVPAENSSDHVSNGIALSPTMHRAFDSGLIYLDSEYVMRLNDDAVSELRNLSLEGGLQHIQSFLDTQIHLPHDRKQRPNPEFIKRGNQYRRIAGYC
jgi:putative restriction endonuclease